MQFTGGDASKLGNSPDGLASMQLSDLTYLTAVCPAYEMANLDFVTVSQHLPTTILPLKASFRSSSLYEKMHAGSSGSDGSASTSSSSSSTQGSGSGGSSSTTGTQGHLSFQFSSPRSRRMLFSFPIELSERHSCS